MRVRFLGQKDSQEEEMAALSSMLAWSLSWAEESGRPQFIGSQRVRQLSNLALWNTKHFVGSEDRGQSSIPDISSNGSSLEHIWVHSGFQRFLLSDTTISVRPGLLTLILFPHVVPFAKVLVTQGRVVVTWGSIMLTRGCPILNGTNRSK